LLTYTRLFRMVFLREWMSYPLNIWIWVDVTR
jgi:hypothetical protein